MEVIFVKTSKAAFEEGFLRAIARDGFGLRSFGHLHRCGATLP